MKSALLKNGTYKVYRVEYKNGVGAYNVIASQVIYNNFISKKTKERLNDFADRLSSEHEDRPSTYIDGGFDHELDTEHRLCACMSQWDLYEWFEGFWDELEELEYSIYEYTLNKVIVGKSGVQAFFDKYCVVTKKRIEFPLFLQDFV